MTAATRLRAEADRRIHDAVAEGLEQLANGWRPAEVVVVLEDAARVIADLRDQADALDERGTACKHPSPRHHLFACYLRTGHPGGHLYTLSARCAA